MRFAKTAVLSLTCCIAISCTTARANPSDRGEKRIEHLRIGWYDSILDLQCPAELAKAGYDIVLPYAGKAMPETARAYLGTAGQAGIDVMLQIPIDLVLEPQGEAFRSYVEGCRDAPALHSWYLFDEPELRSTAKPALLAEAYAVLKELDPGRPVMTAAQFEELEAPEVEAVLRWRFEELVRAGYDAGRHTSPSNSATAWRPGRLASGPRR